MSECHILTEVDIKCKILSTLIVYLGKGKNLCIFFRIPSRGGGIVMFIVIHPSVKL